MNSRDILIIRELAKRVVELAQSDQHVKMRKRFCDTNDLKIVRPPVIIEEIPWHEMNFDGSLDCVCEDEEMRKIEYFLRKSLFREKNFKCDNYLEPHWIVYKSFTNTGNGFEVDEEQCITDKNNKIVSHRYHDIFKNESALEKYRDPVIIPHPEEDEKNVAHMQEVLGDTMPVVLRGHGLYYAPWDRIARMRGMDTILIDMYDNPEYLHKIIALFTRSMSVEMDQMNKYNLYDPRLLDLHCTPNSVTQPQGVKNVEGEYTNNNIWFRTMAQMFSSISPAMHDEFDIQYSLPLAKRCAYTYYGCCEPLHDRINIIKQYPNLRKIGVSPWADVWKSAEAIEGNYVMSRKPNPANVARFLDAEVIRKEICETLDACQKFACPVDITLKDISTVSYRPQNLIEWSKIVSDILDGYYGKE